jgi:hypothetical protein
MLITDIELARKERRLRRLTQKLALLEYELRKDADAAAVGSGAGPQSDRGDARSNRRAG